MDSHASNNLQHNICEVEGKTHIVLCVIAICVKPILLEWLNPGAPTRHGSHMNWNL